MSETEEQKELQDIMEKAPTFRDEGARRRRNRASETPVGKQSGKQPVSVEAHTQWAIEANDTFVAVGSTAEELPSDCYSVMMDDHGRYHFTRKKIATDDLIPLKDAATERILTGIRKFWKSKKRYEDRGILFKRGILMWGPAGSGKTVTVQFLIRELLSMGGIVLYTKDPDLTTGALQVLRRVEPERNLINIMEDCEEIIEEHGEHELLAVLDGEHQTGNVVNIATTNYPERLGPRIVNRPSRFDEVIKVGMPTASMRTQYLEAVLDLDVDKYPVKEWVRDTDGLSIAHLRELVAAITCLDQEYPSVIERLKSMKRSPSSAAFNGPMGFKGSNADPDDDSERLAVGRDWQ